MKNRKKIVIFFSCKLDVIMFEIKKNLFPLADLRYGKIIFEIGEWVRVEKSAIIHCALVPAFLYSLYFTLRTCTYFIACILHEDLMLFRACIVCWEPLFLYSLYFTFANNLYFIACILHRELYFFIACILHLTVGLGRILFLNLSYI